MKKQRKKGLNKVDLLFWLGAVLISLAVGLWWAPPQGFFAFGLFCVVASFLAEPPVRRDDG